LLPHFFFVIIEEYEKNIKKFTKDSELTIYVEIGKTTLHHRSGDYYKAEFNVRINGENYYAVSKREDLYDAISETKEEIIRQIKEKKDRRQTLFKRGAKSIKKMMKGLSGRNPFTSK
jgi:ribosome-associated translation inhibitor RaiA